MNHHFQVRPLERYDGATYLTTHEEDVDETKESSLRRADQIASALAMCALMLMFQASCAPTQSPAVATTPVRVVTTPVAVVTPHPLVVTPPQVVTTNPVVVVRQTACAEG